MTQMAMTYKTLTGRITQHGSSTGIRAKVRAIPMTTNHALSFPDEDRITLGIEVAETGSDGTVAQLKIPTNHGMPELYWRLEVERINPQPGQSKRWTLGHYEITGTGSIDITDLVEIDTILVDAQILVNLSDLVTDAENARDDAEAAAADAAINANGFAIGTTTTGAPGSAAAATITGTAPTRLLNLTIPQGPVGSTWRTGAGAPAAGSFVVGDWYLNTSNDDVYEKTGATTWTLQANIKGSAGAASTVPGPAGRSISTVARTSGTGAAGTTDTYTITYSDATTSTFTVTNGANGAGAGDVVGPASAIDSRVAAFDSTSGKLLKDGGATVAQIRDRSTHTGTQSADTLTDGTTNKAFLATERTKLSGVATGATANATDAQLRDRSTHTGTQSADTIIDGTTNKAYTATEKTKLAGVATGATANDTDVNLKARANHTGTQPASTITGLGTAATVNTGTASGEVPLLGASGTLAVARLATGTPDGTKFVRDDGTLAVPAGGGGSGLLASTAYNPAAVTNVTNATSTYTDVDATNLVLPTFTVPASGAVIFVLTARVMSASASSPALWGVGVGGTVVAASTVRASIGFAAVLARVSHRVKITGLTPGATSSAYRWMHANTGTATTTTTYGGTGVNAEGQALIEVWSA